jgi:hypothetical protein
LETTWFTHPPITGKPFRLYIAAQYKVVGAVFTQEESDQEFTIAYLSRQFLDVETRYMFIEKLCLSLYYACSKFCHYILSSYCVITCQHDVVKYMMKRPILSGRVGKWAYSLVEYDLMYESLRVVKGQVLVDFIIDHGVKVDDASVLQFAHGECSLTG